MSVRCMTWAWEINGLQPSQKLVLLRLADHAQDDGICWPGKHHLAERCGISKRSVDTAIAALVEKGLIRVKRRLTERGTDASNAYELQIIQRDLFQQGTDQVPEKTRGAESAPLGCNDGENTESRGAISDTSRGATKGAVTAPEPYNHNKRTTVGAREPDRPDFSSWQPAAATVKRIKMMKPEITDEFLEQTRLEFLTYAEGHYRIDQLEAKYQANALRQFLRSKRKNAGAAFPQSAADLDAWVKTNAAPPARIGESMPDYRHRLAKWIQDGRPALVRQDDVPGPVVQVAPDWRDVEQHG